MTAPLHIKIGDQFGKWTVIKADGARNKWRCQVVTCRCMCGSIRTLTVSGLKAMASQGCIKCKKPSGLRHGHMRQGKRSLTYMSWQAMKDRCEQTSHREWHRYGGRGITVCSKWQMSFEAFLADMGERPSRQHTIERINNNGHYEPENCKWITRKDQNRNRSTNRLLTFHGNTAPLCVWAEKMGIKQGTIRTRLRLGWSIDDALTMPIREKYRHHRFISGS